MISDRISFYYEKNGNNHIFEDANELSIGF